MGREYNLLIVKTLDIIQWLLKIVDIKYEIER